MRKRSLQKLLLFIIIGFSFTGVLFQLWNSAIGGEQTVKKRNLNHQPLVTFWTILRDNIKLDSLKDGMISSQTEWLEGLHTKNAIESWVRLDSSYVILFGNSDACSFVESFLPPSKGACHPIPCFHSEFKVPQYDCLYNTAAQLATSEFLVYINSDIVLFNDFVKALQTSSSQFDDFLMVGRRIDLQFPHLIDYSNPLWREKLQDAAIRTGKMHGEYGVDYFAYRRIYSPEMPPFLVGRVLWDNYLVAKYIKGHNKTAIDSTKVVLAIHLNHMKIGQSAFRTGTDWNKNLVQDEHIHPKKIGNIDNTDYYFEADQPIWPIFGIGSCPSCTLKKRTQNLEVMLYKYSHDRNVIIATVNEGYVDFALNWYCSLKRVGLSNFIFHAADLGAKKKLEDLGYQAYFYESEADQNYVDLAADSSIHGHVYGSVAYQALMNTRTEFIYKVLQKGYNVLLCDVDIVFFRNPFLFFSPSLDIQGGAHKEQKITGGFLYLRSTPKTMSIWTSMLGKHKEMFKKIQSMEKFDAHAETEQELLNNILLSSTPEKVSWGRIPQTVLADGKNFFIDKATQTSGIWPAAIHNNFIVGKENKYQRFVNISMWHVQDNFQCRQFPSYLPPPPSPLKPNEPFLFIKVITFNRAASLKRLLISLSKAKYGKDQVPLEILIDYPEESASEETLNERLEVIKLAKSFKWKFGEKKVTPRTTNYGLAGQWLNSWYPTSDNQACLFLEDDNEVSPIFYTWAKTMIEKFYLNHTNFDPRLYGISMQHQHMIPGNYPKPPSQFLPKGTVYYRYQQLSTWGPIFFSSHWAEFLVWASDKMNQKGYVPLFSNLITNDWYKMRKGERAVWSAWFMRFAAEKGWYTIYTNFPDASALVVNHREGGINYDKTKGANSPMFTNLDDLTYPESLKDVPLYDFHFNQITEDPSILEDRAIYSDTFNIHTQ